MSEPSSQDKWGDLARSLGADVRAESEETSASSEGPGSAQVSPPRRAPAEPRRPPAGWDQLIGQFGLPMEAAVEPPKTVDSPPSARTKSEEPPPSRPRSVETKARPASPRRESSSEFPGHRPQKDAPQAAPLPPAAAPAEARSNYGLPDWFPFARKRETPPPPAPEQQTPAPPREEAEERIEEPEAVIETGHDIEVEDDRESADVESLKEKRRRPRRRRRGGRGKNDVAEATEKRQAKPAVPIESVVVDLGPAGHDVELFEDDDQDEEPLSELEGEEGEELEEAGTGRTRSANHRNIPSWAEAIGVVVDANLAMRTERKKAARPPGDARGRSRGRRKKRS